MEYKKKSIEVGSLRYRLYHGTKDVHDTAEKLLTSFLFDDTQSKLAYRYFLLQLHVLYEALEEQLAANQINPRVGPIHFPDELNRLHFIKQDLDYLYDNNWRHLLDTDVTSGMQCYAARIREIGKSRPELLIAHSYTRYFGDMSGGQILQRLIKKRYSFPDESGVQFYNFDHVESVPKLKDLYTARMNDIDLSEQEIEDQIEEARRVFQFNVQVFEEISAQFECTRDTTMENLDENDRKWMGQLAQWPSVVKMASVTLGVSVAVVMLHVCPFFAKILELQ